jgi:uncharacterized protein Smg (DUF494 family)
MNNFFDRNKPGMMFDKVLEILIILMHELRQGKDRIDQGTLQELETQGYTKTEISAAFSWLVDRMSSLPEQDTLNSAPTDRSFRVLHFAEMNVLTPEAQGYLIQLREMNILTPRLVEMVIERCMTQGSPVDIPMLRTVVSGLLFHNQALAMMGHRFVIGGDETIH